jgi:hypothetical protein
MIQNIIVIPTNPVSSYSQFFEKEAFYARWLKIFCDIAVIANQPDITIRSKLADQGKVAMFLGYPNDHLSDVFRMWNLKTDLIVKSQNVLWLHKSYKTYKSDAAVSKGNHKAVHNKCFHRYLNKAETINTVDTNLYVQWKQGVVFTVYGWNAGPINGISIPRLVGAMGCEFAFPINLERAP